MPDTKDWTWVLARPCPECGLDASSVAVEDIAPRLAAASTAWADVLGRPGVHDRPAPEVWSPLEYGCHVRDVLGVYDERLSLMLDTDDPLYANWDQDASAGGYAGEDPAAVAAALRDRGLALSQRFAAVTAWDRPGRRSDGASFTVASFARYFLHDVEHHLWDVRAPTD